MNKVFVFLIFLMMYGCNTDCKNDYYSFYNKNISSFNNIVNYSNLSIDLKYYPYANLPADLQQETIQSLYFLVKLKIQTEEKINFSEMHFQSNQIFYLKNTFEDKLILPEMVQPMTIGIDQQIQFLIAFPKDEVIQNSPHELLLNDFFITKEQQSLPVDIDKIISLEKRYCQNND